MSLPQQPQNTKINMSRALMLGSELGFLIALPLAICLLIGVFLDKRLNSFPLFLIISVFAGIALTIIDIYKLVIPFLEKKVGGEKSKNEVEKFK
ncbi:MAG: AtpZ/AtpI family protein [Candidatus Paceibacterota bacterium]